MSRSDWIKSLTCFFFWLIAVLQSSWSSTASRLWIRSSSSRSEIYDSQVIRLTNLTKSLTSRFSSAQHTHQPTRSTVWYSNTLTKDHHWPCWIPVRSSSLDLDLIDRINCLTCLSSRKLSPLSLSLPSPYQTFSLFLLPSFFFCFEFSLLFWILSSVLDSLFSHPSLESPPLLNLEVLILSIISFFLQRVIGRKLWRSKSDRRREWGSVWSMIDDCLLSQGLDSLEFDFSSLMEWWPLSEVWGW